MKQFQFFRLPRTTGDTPVAEYRSVSYLGHFDHFKEGEAFEMVETDITAQHELEQVLASRATEYPAIEKCIEALFEKFAENRPEKFDALQTARLAVKAKYPKPVAL